MPPGLQSEAAKEIFQQMNKDTNTFDASQFDNVPLSDIEIHANSRKIDLGSEPPIPPIVLYLIINGTKFSLATLGNISVIIGKPKAKKSFYLLLLIARMLAATNSAIRSVAHEGKTRIIIFDTEQSINKVHQNAKKILRLAGNPPALELDVYSLRADQVEKRIEIIQHVLDRHDDILFVAIDGFRDLLYDFNDPRESSEKVGLLMKWTEERNIHIVTVLHQNKGDNNARGHAGHELTAKSETVVSVTKDSKNPNISIICAEYTREIEFPQFAIGIDDNGLPYVAEDWSFQNTGDARTKPFSPFDWPETTHFKILNQVFEGGRKLKRSDLCEGIKVALQSLMVPCGDTKVKNLITYYTQVAKWVLKEGADRSPNAFYSLKELGQSLG